MLINVSIRTLSQGTEAIEKIYKFKYPRFSASDTVWSFVKKLIELTATSKIIVDFGLFWTTSSHLPHKSPDLFDSCSSE